MRSAAAVAMVLLTTLFGRAHAQAVEWRLGVAYASGLSDVTDLYEDNLRLAGFDAQVDLKFPIGVAAGMSYDWPSSGWRGDVGLGPVFAIGGDVEHLEVPLSATLGYNFWRLTGFSPYLRAGAIYHFVSGDQYSSSSPGLLAALGVDFTHFTFEVATDRSEVEFDRLSCSTPQSCTLGTESLNTYDIIASFFWRFR